MSAKNMCNSNYKFNSHKMFFKHIAYELNLRQIMTMVLPSETL